MSPCDEAPRAERCVGGGGGADGLRASEEDWRPAFERLQERFPRASPEVIAKALRDAGGHAGRAAAVLRTASGSDSTATHDPPRTGAPVSAANVAGGLFSAERAFADARSGVPRYAEAAGADKFGSSSATERASTHSPVDVPAAGNLVEALSRESQRLREELDGALARARAEAERKSAERKKAGRTAGRSGKTDRQPSENTANPGDSEKHASAEPRFCTSQFWAYYQTEASGSKCGAELVKELQSSCDEGRQLKRELQGDILAGGVQGAEAAAERERLKRELDVALTLSAIRKASFLGEASPIRGERRMSWPGTSRRWQDSSDEHIGAAFAEAAARHGVVGTATAGASSRAANVRETVPSREEAQREYRNSRGASQRSSRVEEGIAAAKAARAAGKSPAEVASAAADAVRAGSFPYADDGFGRMGSGHGPCSAAWAAARGRAESAPEHRGSAAFAAAFDAAFDTAAFESRASKPLHAARLTRRSFDAADFRDVPGSGLGSSFGAGFGKTAGGRTRGAKTARASSGIFDSGGLNRPHYRCRHGSLSSRIAELSRELRPMFMGPGTDGMEVPRAAHTQ